MRHIRSVVVALTTIVLSCGGSSSGDSSPTPEQACSDAAETLCSAIERCAPFYTALLWPDHATCAERSRLNCPASLKLEGTSATPAAIESCLMAVSSASCGDIFRGIEACATKPGMLVNGHACAAHAQCQSAFCSPSGAGDGCGVCADKALSGAACGVDEQCADGQKCVNIGTFAMPNKNLRGLPRVGGHLQHHAALYPRIWRANRAPVSRRTPRGRRAGACPIPVAAR